MSREEHEIFGIIAKKEHDERVKKAPERIKFAIEQFEKNEIEYELKTSKRDIFIVGVNLTVNYSIFGQEQEKFKDMIVCAVFVRLYICCKRRKRNENIQRDKTNSKKERADQKPCNQIGKQRH